MYKGVYMLKKPDYPVIYLIYLGDSEGWGWCDDPTPSNDNKPEDAIKYVQDPPWQTVDKFKEQCVEGACFISYKGRVLMAYHDHKGYFRFSEYSPNVYMAECIRAVKFIEYPCTPTKEEIQAC